MCQFPPSASPCQPHSCQVFSTCGTNFHRLKGAPPPRHSSRRQTRRLHRDLRSRHFFDLHKREPLPCGPIVDLVSCMQVTRSCQAAAGTSGQATATNEFYGRHALLRACSVALRWPAALGQDRSCKGRGPTRSSGELAVADRHGRVQDDGDWNSLCDSPDDDRSSRRL